VKMVEMSESQRTKILIVDDLQEKLLVYDAILRDMDLDLVMAPSGEKALGEVLNSEFAVILLDVNMPGMDGFETANLIRSRKKSAHTPIIFVTAYNDEFRMAEGYSRGAVDFITTPIIPQILRAKIRVFVDLFRMTQQVREHAQQQIALTAERAQRTAAEEANRRLSFLVKAGSMIARTLDKRVIVESIVRLLVPEQADMAALALTAESGSTVTLAMPKSGSLHIQENVKLDELPPLYREAIQRITTARPLELEQVADLSGASVEPRFLALPLREQESTIAILLVSNADDRAPFSPADLQLMQSIASRSAIALTKAKLYEELEFANQQKNRFLSMLAHELRNPLAPIQSAVDLMRLCRLDNEDLRSARNVIDRQVSHMVRLVDDLLDISRITLGKIRLNKGRFDARNIITSALEISAPLIDERKHKLEVEVPSDPILIDGDTARLSQVLSNLLNNAAKYTPPPGSIRLSLRPEGKEAVFRVRDTGVGIPSSMLGRVFDLFIQVDHASEQSQGGLGVGLTLVKELIDMHGGRVDVSSAGIGQGSEFSVAIPRIMEAQSA
jgi:signal transduction histidine kinase